METCKTHKTLYDYCVCGEKQRLQKEKKELLINYTQYLKFYNLPNINKDILKEIINVTLKQYEKL